MLKFVEMEFLKLKNSKVFLLTLLGSLAPALLIYLGFAGRVDYGEPLTYALLSSQTNLYMLGIFGIFLTTIVVSYIFSREFNEHTLKSIFPSPVSRAKYLIGKFISFIIWVLILCSVCFFASTLLCYATGISGLTVDLFLKYYGQMLFGGFLLSLVMAPLMFISMLIKNMVPAMISAAILTFGNIIVYGHEQLIYDPWMLPSIISSGEIVQYTSNLAIPYSVIAIAFVVGIILSYVFLTQKDVRL